MSQFEEYQEQNNFGSRSEAMRQILREHLADDEGDDQQVAQQASTQGSTQAQQQIVDAFNDHRFIAYSLGFLLVADQVQRITMLAGAGVSSFVQLSIFTALMTGLLYQQVYQPTLRWLDSRSSDGDE